MQTVSVWQGRRESRPQGWATILRGSWRRLLSLSLLWGALLLRPDSTLGDDGRTVTDVRVGTDDGRLVIELGASGPLRNYALAEEADPFTLILYLPNTTLAFPATPRRLEAGSLREVIPETFEHAGRPLSQLAFVFAHQATYRVRADGPRLFLRVDLDGVPDTMLLGSETAPPAPSTSTPEETASKQTAVESAPSAPGAPLALAETSEAS